MNEPTNELIKTNTFRPAMRAEELRRLYEYLEETGIRVGHFVRKAIVEKLDRDERKGRQ